MAARPIIFQTSEVARLLKASRFTLNRLMIRCQIETSFGSRGRRGSRLLFTVEDASKLALAYWLFRSGLRSPAIEDALAHRQAEEFCRKLTDADEVERAGNESQFLVTWRVAKGKHASQEIIFEKDFAGVQRVLETEPQYGFVVIPIGRLLQELARRIRSNTSGN